MLNCNLKGIGTPKALFWPDTEYRRANFDLGWSARVWNSAEFPSSRQEIDQFFEFSKKLRWFGQRSAVWADEISPGIVGWTRSRCLTRSFEQTRQAGSVVVPEPGGPAAGLSEARGARESFWSPGVLRWRRWCGPAPCSWYRSRHRRRKLSSEAWPSACVVCWVGRPRRPRDHRV